MTKKKWIKLNVNDVENDIACAIFEDSTKASTLFNYFEMDEEAEARILARFFELFSQLSCDYIDVEIDIPEHHVVAPYAGLFGVRFAIHDTNTNIFHTTNGKLEITGILTIS